MSGAEGITAFGCRWLSADVATGL